MSEWPFQSSKMALRVRGYEWTGTPLGPIESWPQGLKTIVDLMLASPSMMSLVWGSEATHLYNDRFTELLHEHRYEALGKSAFETFARSRDVFAADVAAGMSGKSNQLLAQRYPVLRGGELVDAWFDVDYAPVRDEGGGIGGVLWTLKEVTAQVQAERALRESDARSNYLIGTWAKAMWETDASGVVVADSPTWRGYTGQSVDEWLGYGWLDAIHPDDRANAERQWHDAIAAGSLLNAEIRLRASGGGWCWTNVRAAPVLNQEGYVQKWAGMNIDIDARKQAEAALSRSEHLRRIALSGGRMGTWRWDRKADQILGDEQFFQLWGVPLTNKAVSLANFAANMSEEGAAEMEAVVAKALAANEEFSGPLEIVSGPRSGRWIQWQGRAAANDPGVLYGVTFDVTEQRATEAALRESEKRQTFLLKLSDAVRPLADPAAIQGETTRVLREHLNAGWCYYVEWDLGRKAGLVLRDSVRVGLSSLAGVHDVSDAPEFLQLLAVGDLLTVRDYANYGQLPLQTRRKFTALGFRSMMAAPLIKEGRLRATLLVGDTELRDWSPNEASILFEAAERTWDAVERAHVEEALRQSEGALAADLANAELLRSLSERLVPENGLQAVYDEVLSATISIVRADAGTIQIYDPATQTLELIASQNFSRTITDYYDRVDAGSRSACGIALKTGALAFADFPKELADVGCQLLVGEGIQSAVAYPLKSRTGVPLGMINAHWRCAGHRPNERELRFLGLLARQAADLIEQRRSQGALRESEARQRALIEGVPQLVWRASNSGEWTWASTQWTEFTDQSVEDSRGWGWLEPLHPDDRTAAREAWAKAIDTGVLEVDYRICAPSQGEYRWFQTRATPLRNDEGAVIEWLGTSTDVDDLRRLQDRQEVLVAELQHRTRNLMGVVRSMADKTARASADLPDFRARFRERLEALSRVQGLLSRLNDHDRVTFDELVETELAAMGNGAERVRLEGEKGVRLRSSMVQTLAMAVHELATNAVKYGALGQAGGQLVVKWRLAIDKGTDQTRLHIDWRESGVTMPPVGLTPTGGGQGRELIEKALPYQLSAKTTYELGPDGVHCTISIPISTTSGQGEDHA